MPRKAPGPAINDLSRIRGLGPGSSLPYGLATGGVDGAHGRGPFHTVRVGALFRGRPEPDGIRSTTESTETVVANH